LGALVVGLRSADEPFTDREMRLLRDLAPQVAVALHAAIVTDDLRRARLDLVRSREEERRRLRRDIHDGLGPTLAGAMLQLDTLREMVAGVNPEADVLAAMVKDKLRLVIDDVRRVSQGLRPPALDELGLAAALREQAQSLTAGTGLVVEVYVNPTAADAHLGAAVEVAVYRIASEALANVVKHAQARHCTVRLALGGSGIELEVLDDGVGVPDGATAGVGLRSMQDRAAELGGTFSVEDGQPSGTRVRSWLPRVH
jgi:signal transduction histidine kinase